MKLLAVLLMFFVSKGSIQELKIFGTPGMAEVQCENSFKVSSFFQELTLAVIYNYNR